MGHQIVKQPDGRYAIFSTIVDDWIYYNATKEDLIEWAGDRARMRAQEEIEALLTKIGADDGKPYHQFTKTFEELDQIVFECHGTRFADFFQEEGED